MARKTYTEGQVAQLLYNVVELSLVILAGYYLFGVWGAVLAGGLHHPNPVQR